MPKNYSHLLSPLTVGKVTFKNRICAAPQSIPCCYEGWKKHVRLSYQGMRFFLEKAKGGSGMVTVGEIDVNDDFFQNPDSFDLSQFTTLARGIKNYGAVASLEIGCRGSKDYNDTTPNAVIWGPSAMYNPGAGKNKQGSQITEMTMPDMEEMARRYANAAEVCLMCGYDMIMIHGGHGFLLSQFISPLYNKRNDEFGGSVENRARFPLMILQAIRERVGDQLLIEYRISADEIVDSGLHIEETVEICKLLEEYIDIVHASAGSSEQGADNNIHTTVYKGKTPNLQYAAALKNALNIPVTTVGAYSDPAEADAVVADGKADFICFSRQILADAHMAEKLTYNEPWEMNVCLRCSGCMSAPAPNLYAKCAVNPTANYEFLYDPEIRPSSQKRKVLVIGGGAAGMVAAVTAHDRGHNVTLVEQSERLGGIINFADNDYYKERLPRWRDSMVRRIQSRAIDLRLGTPATVEMIRREQPDAVIAATGSIAATPPIPGIETAMHVLDMYAQNDGHIGHKVVMVGGGLAGCEAALSLAAKGHEVTLVEMQREFAPDAYPMARGAMLVNLEREVECLPGHSCLEILPNGVRLAGTDGERLVEADTVIYALGMCSRNFDALRAAQEKEFIAVGDCVKPAKLMEAIHSGYFAAINI